MLSQQHEIEARSQRKRRMLRVALFLETAAFTAGPMSTAAFAQSSEPADAARVQLEEIVVTAQKRTERLQDAPLAISAFSSEALAQSGISSVGEISQVDPSLNITHSAGVFLPFLRGVGNPAANTIGNEASVPVYIDDVYYTRLSAPYLELNSVERVEVLKGPQGTLFGRNSSGGLIQVFTRDPGRTSKFDGTIGYGNYDTATIKLYASQPLSESLAMNVAVAAQRQGDGWGTNLTTGRDIYKGRYFSLRSKILWEASPTTKVKVSFFYARERSSLGFDGDRPPGTVSGTPLAYGPAQPLLSHADLGHYYDATLNADPYQTERGWGASAHLDQDLGFASLVSITAFRKASGVGVYDADFSSFDYLNYDLHHRDRQISQELQLKSPSRGKISWIVGTYYLNSRQGYRPGRIYGDAVGGPGFAIDIYSTQTINSYSAYAQTTIPLDDKLNVTAGVRYTKDNVRGQGFQNFVVGDVPFPFLAADGGQDPYNDNVTFEKLTYKGAIDYHFTRDVMAYATVSRGYKSGTFNTLPLDGNPAKAEIIDAYEFGLKTEILDRRIRLNAAIFQNDIKNPQVYTSITRGAVSVVGLTNAEKARVKGAEFSAVAVISHHLTLSSGVTYLDAKYLRFQNGPFFFPIAGPPYGLDLVIQPADGNRLSQVPKVRFNVGMNYDQETSIGRFQLNINASYTGRYAWDPDNILKQGAVTLINTSLAFIPAGSDRFTFELWSKNLTDKKYYGHASPNSGSTGTYGSPGEPRTFGVRISISY